jgi:hypothetical protein
LERQRLNELLAEAALGSIAMAELTLVGALNQTHANIFTLFLQVLLFPIS